MTEKIGQVINGFQEIFPRHVGGTDYRVLSIRNGTTTAYDVDVADLDCTCPDHEYNQEDPEICDHLAAALFQAPARLTLDEWGPYAFSEVIDRAEDAAELAEDAAAALVDGQGEADTEETMTAAEAMDSPDNEPDRDPVTTTDVSEWLETGFASPELVHVMDGDHDGVPGVVLEPDNQGMPDHVYESFKGLVNSLDGSEIHVGFGDEPCNTCGRSDGEFWYFIPGDDASEVWA
jgi:hypothetical protein